MSGPMLYGIALTAAKYHRNASKASSVSSARCDGCTVLRRSVRSTYETVNYWS